MRRLLLTTAIVLGACQNVTPVSSDYFPVSQWRHEDGQDQPYLLAPGDTVSVIFRTAPELSQDLKVAPDGSITLPYVGPVQASARTASEVRADLIQAFANELKNPELDVIPVGFESQRIFVGGEVRQPGMMELPGQIDPLQAVIMAGGFTDRAQPRQVALMRRMPGGDVMTAVIDVNAGINNPELASFTPLRRFDVVFVPRSAIANENLLMEQWFRSALPIDFSLYYDIGGDLRGR
jgi:polysaccharide export outer membrane protein